MSGEYDFIVVGAGSAGCVLANRLTTDPGTSLLLLEAGGPDANPAIHIPAAWPTLHGTEVDWAYATEAEPHLHDAAVPTPRGKTLGGTSSINAMVYIRGNRADYDHWRSLGNSGWGYDDVLPFFKRSEDQQRGANEFHGTGGPLHVSDSTEPSTGSFAFLRAAEAMGHRANNDFNGELQDGCGLYQRTIKDGRRQSAAVAFLHPVLGRPNLATQTGALVERIIIEKNRAVGVSYSVGGVEHRAIARREVILAAGAINTPKVLLLSGVGPADHLREMGIAVTLDLPGVGANLHDHPLVKVVFQTQHPFPVAPTSNLAEAGLFMNTGVNPNDSAPDVQFHFAPVLWPHPQFACAGPGFTIGVNVARPESRGNVWLRSANPADAPCIRANYMENERDLERMVRGVEEAIRIALHSEFAGATPLVPGVGVDLKGFVRQACETIWHPVGTSKMGADRMSVVDADLRVRGIAGLSIADTSVMPKIVSGNTNAPAIMIGEKAAHLRRR